MPQKSLRLSIVLTFFVSVLGLYSFAPFQTKNENETIKFFLLNNSLLPKKITLISYEPGTTSNGTNGYMLTPYGTKKISFPVGTKLYLADRVQVDTVMSGNRLTGKPFHVVTAKDAGQKIEL